MKHSVLFVCITVCLIFAGCNRRQESAEPAMIAVNNAEYENDTTAPEPLHSEQTLLRPKQSLLTADDITLIKELLYDQYTLEDTYPYKDTVRSFKWDVIRNCLAYIENMQTDTAGWVVLQNYKNLNKEAPLVRKFVRNAYRRVSDTLGVERYQSVPLYLPADTLVPERYGRDGTIAYLRGEEGSFCRIHPATFDEEWLVPRRYLKLLADSTTFDHVVFVCPGDSFGHVSDSAEKGTHGIPERRFRRDGRICAIRQLFYKRCVYTWGTGECAAYQHD